eukprot:jgi/Chlat1/944/Chrsp108S01373
MAAALANFAAASALLTPSALPSPTAACKARSLGISASPSFRTAKKAQPPSRAPLRVVAAVPRRPPVRRVVKTVQEEKEAAARAKARDGPSVNEEITAATLRVLDNEKNMLGVFSRREALTMAEEQELDLVMISPEADPPVTRIMDYSKYKYEQEKKKREERKKAAANRVEIKELKMRYNIDVHDYQVRLRAAQRFLADGDKVKVTAQFRGREVAQQFRELAQELFERLANDLSETAVMEGQISFEGRNMQMTLAPNKAALAKPRSNEPVSN